MDFSKVFQIWFLDNFQCQYTRRQSLNRHWSVLLNQTPLQLQPPDLPLWVSLQIRWRGVWGGIIWGNISVKGGDYLREVINRGTAIIRGNTVKASLDFSNYYLRVLFFPLKKVHVLFSSTKIQYQFHVFSFRAFLSLRVVVIARLYKTWR